MAKKKMSKKTKYTLLGIGLVAVGAGYFIAKHLKSNVSGIGAVRYSFPMRYRGAVISYKPIIKAAPYTVEVGDYADKNYFFTTAKNVKQAKAKVDSWLDKIV